MFTRDPANSVASTGFADEPAMNGPGGLHSDGAAQSSCHHTERIRLSGAVIRRRTETMKTIAKLAMGAAMLGGLALTAAAPADAGVAVGINIGGGHHGCWHHRHCGGPVVVVGPRVGVFYAGRGYWDGHRYWGHRDRWHGHWRYR
jgi:hypothetical protein